MTDKEQDEKAIAELIARWSEAAKAVDIPKLREIYYESCRFSGHFTGEYLDMHIEAFYTILEETKHEMDPDQFIRPDFGQKILLVDVSNDIAMVKLERRGWVGLDRFIFYVNLNKIAGRWWVVSTSFTHD